MRSCYENLTSSTQKKIHVIYAFSERKVTFICPECGYNRTLTESEKDQYQTSFGLDCKCGVKYECRIDFRKHYRKSVNLPGTYFQTESWVRGDIRVHNIALRGVGFYTISSHQLKLGDIIQVKFLLDDKRETEIDRQMVVRSIERNHIGAQFAEQLPYDKDLGFYLLR